MTKITRLCNKCGKEIEAYNDFNVAYQFGYESKHDGEHLDLDLCGACLDSLITYLADTCVINPITE